ncbi:MAG: transcription elongation factor GreA, partial [Muribaculaceae bacterium]|nr:transcription elongation factor GreA [Muribaculaceae bacterium]
MAITYMTKEGYDKKMAELAHLENVERPDVVRAIAEARDKGDLSENAEYDAAKERQGMLEAKISQLKTLVANARIIDESKISTDEVQLLTRVTIKNVKNGA